MVFCIFIIYIFAYYIILPQAYRTEKNCYDNPFSLLKSLYISFFAPCTSSRSILTLGKPVRLKKQPLSHAQIQDHRNLAFNRLYCSNVDVKARHR